MLDTVLPIGERKTVEYKIFQSCLTVYSTIRFKLDTRALTPFHRAVSRCSQVRATCSRA